MFFIVDKNPSYFRNYSKEGKALFFVTYITSSPRREE